MELTVKLLRTRLQSRLALHKQFASLGECLAPHLMPGDGECSSRVLLQRRAD